MSRRMKTMAVATLVAVLAIPAPAAAEKKKSFWSKVGFVAGVVTASVVAGAVCVGTGPLCAAGITLAATGAGSGAGALVDKATGRDWQVTTATGPVPIGKADPSGSSPPETSASEVVTEIRRTEVASESKTTQPGTETEQKAAEMEVLLGSDVQVYLRMRELDEAASMDDRSLDARRIETYREQSGRMGEQEESLRQSTAAQAPHPPAVAL